MQMSKQFVVGIHEKNIYSILLLSGLIWSWYIYVHEHNNNNTKNYYPLYNVCLFNERTTYQALKSLRLAYLCKCSCMLHNFIYIFFSSTYIQYQTSQPTIMMIMHYAEINWVQRKCGDEFLLHVSGKERERNKRQRSREARARMKNSKMHTCDLSDE